MKVATISFDPSKRFSQLFGVIDAGKSPKLYVANPDIIYPKREGEFTLAVLSHSCSEAGLNRRYPGRNNQFIGLGKPYAPIFNAAKKRHPKGKPVMVGDQLDTKYEKPTRPLSTPS